MLTMRAATGCPHERFRTLGRNRKRCDGDRCGCDQDRVPKYAVGQKGVTSNCDREADRPHQPKHLKHIVPDGDIRDVAKRAYSVVKHEVPCPHDKVFDKYNQRVDPF